LALHQLDCRGLACPQPVLETKKALEKVPRGTVVVIVDNEAARENLTLTRGEAAPDAPEARGCAAAGGDSGQEARPVYFFTGNVIGQGSPDLGETLMKSLFTTLVNGEPAPAAVIFMNTGVYLSTEGSPVLDALRRLAAAGTDVLSCGTCLDYFGLREKLAVGRVSNMYEINAYLAGPHRVITVA